MVSLTATQKKFISHWSEIGTRWGINRTVAQVHALLYIVGRALNADDVTEILSVSRSNVSTSLRELQNWGLIKVVHILGDRRDHFESVRSVWDMCLVILDERKRREIDPAVDILRICMAEADRGGTADAATRRRLQEMLQFFEMMTSWYMQVRNLPRDSVLRLVKLGTKVGKLLGPKW
jgi:DNA-binding transcriptional regulator GbsR (MarR family)